MHRERAQAGHGGSVRSRGVRDLPPDAVPYPRHRSGAGASPVAARNRKLMKEALTVIDAAAFSSPCRAPHGTVPTIRAICAIRH